MCLPIGTLRLESVERDDFFLIWGGVEYPGNHEPLVNIETFALVQAFMASRRHGGDKPRKHLHYLKGTVFCARCKSRLIFSQNRGRSGGLYDYFVCSGRHRHTYPTGCELPYIHAELLEQEVENYYDTIVLEPGIVKSIYDGS
jgi:site-specific DNA recombinase